MVVSIQLSDVSFSYPLEEHPVFNKVSLTLPQKKIGLVGPNGCGKSTLLSLISGQLKPCMGKVLSSGSTYLSLSQKRECYESMRLSELFGVHEKWQALKRVEKGELNTCDFELIGEDWLLQERINKALETYTLSHVTLDTSFNALSGGEQTKVLLISLFEKSSDYLLLDEPSNHLDTDTKAQFIKALKNNAKGCLIASHDRALLNEMEMIVEIRNKRLFVYGGNYTDYKTQKDLEHQALDARIKSGSQELQKAQKSFQTRREVHEQGKARGREVRKTLVKKFGRVKGKMALDSKKGRSEKTNKRILTQGTHAIDRLKDKLIQSKSEKEINETLNISLPQTNVPKQKVVLEVDDLSFSYSEKPLIKDFSLTLWGPERLLLAGPNGTGKTSLLKCLTQELITHTGTIKSHVEIKSLDQADLKVSAKCLTVIDYFLLKHPDIETEKAHSLLAQFLFRGKKAFLPVTTLSGGEMLRLKLALLLNGASPPQLLLLDEPTNHLDIQSVALLEQALIAYQGALILVSHDEAFIQNIGINKVLRTPFLAQTKY